ncbi:MAG: DUF2384 domain-containing protein [Hyphomicrobium sp.]|nr:DUF2384 domain-containing protein [Hyphomicrobium sp.]
MNHPRRSVYRSFVRSTARALFGARRADRWLARSNEHLGGHAPLTVASDLRGAERVLAELTRSKSK